jgi:hypothetical protein
MREGWGDKGGPGGTGTVRAVVRTGRDNLLSTEVARTSLLYLSYIMIYLMFLLYCRTFTMVDVMIVMKNGSRRAR